MTYQITLPYPPSTNVYYRNYNGVTVVSKESALFKREVWLAVYKLGFPPKFNTKISLLIEFYGKKGGKRDLDNCIKATQDALQDAGVFIDDYNIDDLRVVRRGRCEGGKIVCTITEIGE